MATTGSAGVETAVAVVLARPRGLVDYASGIREGGRRWVLRFFVDKPGGVGIRTASASAGRPATCSTSRTDRARYDLEVSSPGLDRELRKDREFRWAVGSDVHCWVRRAGGRADREFSGRLVQVVAGRADAVTLEPEHGGACRGRLVTKARLELQPRLGRTRD